MGFRDLEKLRERVELLEDGLRVHNLRRGCLSGSRAPRPRLCALPLAGTSDPTGFRWSVHANFMYVREGFRLRVAEGDELA